MLVTTEIVLVVIAILSAKVASYVQKNYINSEQIVEGIYFIASLCVMLATIHIVLYIVFQRL